MRPALAALVAFAIYFSAYRFYSKFLAEKVFRLDRARKTPAHTQNDGVDYVPTRPPILFGHHFASITGLAPMLGPAVAVIWGWVPALLWVVFGAVFIGCVHDFSALVVSLRARGLSVGKVAEGVIGRRAGLLFHLIILFGISLAMGVFVFVIAKLFSLEIVPGKPGYPQAVLPSGLLMLIALGAGYLLYRKQFRLLPVALGGFALELVAIWLGHKFPTLGLSVWPTPAAWTYVLLGYAFLASVLPVWVLLQSRDFLNSLLLYLGLGLAYIGLFVGNPEFVAPAVDLHPEGAPSMLPFVFIFIACGAASGFHGLVSSGTTAKQLDVETDARPIGYGGMIGESLLGLLAVLACTAGFASREVWHEHYASWGAAAGLATKIDAFIQGTTHFVTQLGISEGIASALIAMVVVSFALTTLDSATRLLRFNIEEITSTISASRVGRRIGFSAVARVITNRYVASILACGAIGFFAFYEVEGPGGTSKPAALALWQLFGTTNQLLAGLTLTLVTLYLKHRRWPIWFTGVPAVFMMGSTIVAMVGNLKKFGAEEGGDKLLFVVGAALLGLAVWLVFEAALAIFAKGRHTVSAEIDLPGEDGADAA